jgi:AcrR family transcriptional regulator
MSGEAKRRTRTAVADVHPNGTRSRPGRAEQRERFLRAAADLVATEGVGAVTMERVAARAELSKPLIYKHFSDRSDLLCALLEECWTQLDVAVQARLRSATTFDAHIRALISAYFEEVVSQGRLLQVLITVGTSEPRLEEARRARHRDAETQWSLFYQERGGLPAPVADATAAILRSALEGATTYWLEHPRHDPSQDIEVCTDVMLGALSRLRRQHRQVEPPPAAGRRSPARG